jgi:hypothetical protein
MNSKPISTLKLNQLQRQLAAWRRTDRPRQAIPEPLWQDAATLAQDLGVSPVARARLDRRRLGADAVPGPDLLAPTAMIQTQKASFGRLGRIVAQPICEHV